MRVVVAVCLMMVAAASGVLAEEQKTTVSFDYRCYDQVQGASLDCGLDMYLKGTINAMMLEKFRRILGEIPTARRTLYRVYIDSSGGSLQSAMDIGRIVRQREMSVTVKANTSCASACVLVFAAGVSRDRDQWAGFASFAPSLPREPGAVGVHRAYIAETPQQPVTIAAVKQSTDRTITALRTYFREMNVSDRLADDMMTVPPEKIRWLKGDELTSYGLVETDPVWQETQDLNEAQRYGISRLDYMQRKALSGKVCGMTDAEVGLAISFEDLIPGRPENLCRERVIRTGR